MNTLQAYPAGTPGHYTTQRRLLPSAEKLAYLKDLLEVFILLLALPSILGELLHNPTRLSARMAGHHSLRG
jgi:hypothetical protein